MRQLQMNLDRRFPLPREIVRTVQLFRAQVLRHSSDTGEVTDETRRLSHDTKRDARDRLLPKKCTVRCFHKKRSTSGITYPLPLAPTLNVEEHATAEAVPTSS